jgi:hypothetical protein
MGVRARLRTPRPGWPTGAPALTVVAVARRGNDAVLPFVDADGRSTTSPVDVGDDIAAVAGPCGRASPTSSRWGTSS